MPMAAFWNPLSIPADILSDTLDGPDDIWNTVGDILDIADGIPNVVFLPYWKANRVRADGSHPPRL
jgi:hypothetical protein